MKRVLASMVVVLTGGCGPSPSAESCLDGPVLLSASADDGPVATPWSEGRFFVLGESGEGFDALDLCTGEREAFRADTRILTIVGGGVSCDRATGDVFPSDDLGYPTGDPIATVKGCEVAFGSSGERHTWLGLGPDDRVRLFDREGVVAVLDAAVRGIGRGTIDRGEDTWFLVDDDAGNLHAVDPATGESEFLVANVGESMTRGSRVFFRAEPSAEVQVFDVESGLSRTLPTSVLAPDCTLSIEGLWYLLPPVDQPYCDRDADPQVVHIESGQAFDVPEGLHPTAVQDDRILLVGDALAMWDPLAGGLEVLWDHAVRSAQAVPSASGELGWSVVDEGSGQPHVLLIPVDGTAPYDLMGGHAAQWVYHHDASGSVGRSPEDALIRTDAATGTLEVLDTRVVDAQAYELPELGHSPLMIYERIASEGSSRELWVRPLAQPHG